MAKINKKKSKVLSQSKQIRKNEKKDNKIKFKECAVNLIKMSELEYNIYSESDVIKTASFNLKIKGGQLEIADHGNGLQTQYSESRNFNITLKKSMNSYILEDNLITAGMCSKFRLIFRVK